MQQQQEMSLVLQWLISYHATVDHGLFFSHKFSYLLVGQMEAALEGQDINVRIRTSKVTGGELKCWPDSLADDYIHRPLQKEFEDICFYDMTSQ
jgi:hypothetical protein